MNMELLSRYSFYFYFKDAEIITYFLEQENKLGESSKQSFTSLKKAFEIKNIEKKEAEGVQPVVGGDGTTAPVGEETPKNE